MRMIRLVLALSAMVCLAATSTLARESHRSSSASKTRAAKHAKISRSKGSTTKHKSTAARRAAGKKANAHRKGNQAHGTGEIDASTAVWEDLPPEDLPVSDADDNGEPDDIDEPPPTP